MAPDSSGFRGGLNFSVPLHDRDQQYRTITTGLIKVQNDVTGGGFSDFLMENADPNDPNLPNVSDPAHIISESINGCSLSVGANRSYFLPVGEYVESQRRHMN